MEKGTKRERNVGGTDVGSHEKLSEARAPGEFCILRGMRHEGRSASLPR